MESEVIAAPEAERSLSDLNNFDRTEWHDAWFAAVKPVFIFSLFWRDIWRTDLATLGTVRIPACPPGAPHGPAVGFHGYCADGGFRCNKRHAHEPAVPGMDKDEYRLSGGDGQMGFRPITGKSIAASIIGTDSGSPGMSPHTTSKRWYGVFLAAGPVPTREEIAAAHADLRAFATMIVNDVDHMPNDKNGQKPVEEIHREMLEFLHEKRSWANMPTGRDLCPQCQEPMQTATKRHGCGYMVDPEWLFNEGQIDRELFDRVMASRTNPGGSAPGQPKGRK